MPRNVRIDLTDWLLGAQARALPTTQMLGALCRRLVDAGVPIWRGHLGGRTMHPEVFVQFYDWYEGDVDASEKTLPHSMAATDTVTKSPVAQLIATREPVRVKLDGPREDIPFPMLRELQDKGASDYLCLPLAVSGSGGNMVSWSTRERGGFSAAHVAVLEGILPALSIRMELDFSHFAMASLLRTYLGRNAATRVMAGEFRRGQGEVVDAAIWMSDLRGFTGRVDSTPLPAVLEALNTYFTCVGDTIIEEGGEILKFIGDAVLAVFPLDQDPRGACRRALNAAEQALARMHTANEERRTAGLDALEFGVVLHRGDVMYGNIGATDRLDFTVIGKAVNEASRVESLCKELGTPLLFTEAFASVACDERAVSLGRHELRGVRQAPEIFTHAALKKS